MDFSSISSFLDPPINMPQSPYSNNHLQLQESGSIVSGHQQLLSHHFPQNRNPNHHHADTKTTATIDLSSINGPEVERARQAKNTQPPEEALKCPRCDSANTKFCYFNNYNLKQPRHFCKNCRRYWTRGGTLRNVPVGGKCRKNKKGKSKNSKSSSSSQNKQSTSMVNTPNLATTSNFQLQTSSQFPFFPTLQNFSQLGDIGLNLAAINGGNHSSTSSFLNELRFLHGSNSSGPVMSNNNNNNNYNGNNIMTSLGSPSHFDLFDRTNTTRVSAPVKIEETHLGNISRPGSGLTFPRNQSNQYGTGLGLTGSSSNDHLQHLM